MCRYKTKGHSWARLYRSRAVWRNAHRVTQVDVDIAKAH